MFLMRHVARKRRGAVAQLGEHLLCKQGVNGSIPFSSTKVSRWPSILGLLADAVVATL